QGPLQQLATPHHVAVEPRRLARVSADRDTQLSRETDETGRETVLTAHLRHEGGRGRVGGWNDKRDQAGEERGEGRENEHDSSAAACGLLLRSRFAAARTPVPCPPGMRPRPRLIDINRGLDPRRR